MLNFYLNMSIGGAVLCAIVALVSRIGKKRLSARMIYALWALVGVRFLCPFLVPLGDMLTTQTYTPALVQMDASANFYQPDGTEGNKLEGAPPETSAAIAEDQFGLVFGPVQIIYNIGFFLLLFLADILDLRIRRKLQTAVQFIPSAEMQVVYEALGVRLGIKTLPPCYTTDAVTSPCLYGLRHQKILLPAGLAPDDARLPHIWAHELTHYAAKDQVRLHFRKAILLIHWWNPLAWLYFLLARADCEHACDERVLALYPDASCAYGETLLSLTGTRHTIAAHSMSIAGRTLQSRLLHILKPVKMQKRSMMTSLLCVTLAAALSVSSFATTPKSYLADFPTMQYADLDALVMLKNKADSYSQAVSLLPLPYYDYVLGDVKRDGNTLRVTYTHNTAVDPGIPYDAYRAAREENNALLLFCLYDDVQTIVFRDANEATYARDQFINPISPDVPIADLYLYAHRTDLEAMLAQNMMPKADLLAFDRIRIGSPVTQYRTRWGDFTMGMNAPGWGEQVENCVYYRDLGAGYGPDGTIEGANIAIGSDLADTSGETDTVCIAFSDNPLDTIVRFLPMEREYGTAITLDYFLTHYHAHTIQEDENGNILIRINMRNSSDEVPDSSLYLYFKDPKTLQFIGIADNRVRLTPKIVADSMAYFYS